MSEKKKYLTVHGHFYQPPRENPWLEAIEQQDSALPFHNWNSRITCECYTPNSVSKIVDYKNQILDIVNNYSFMSFNFGPTLMSWLETHEPYTYERIIKADVESSYRNSGHGNAMAQVYNHIIMPLANKKDKITQTIWGIRDFQYRFGRMPEGIWLAETAADDETMEVLVDCGIKFTVLSPYQAQKCRKMGEKDWTDVSWGSIDPAKPYRYYIKSNPEKYIDLFFYDGSISKSVAFDELLTDGNKFISRLKEGICDCRDYNQLVNIATDGESYGHHTKFGDMALAYILRVKANDEGFTVTNYANYLDIEGVHDEVEIKPVSSWSCAHGVGRWCEDCGCSTGGGQGWNQSWRRPLRDALDYLRDEISIIFEKEAEKYFKSHWDARNEYIEVILDRNEFNIQNFLEKNCKEPLQKEDRVKALKLMEMQRQAMLMYTSCGWFFSEISGLETTQIMKYAAKAIELVAEFSEKDLETNFTEILSKAQSNIPGFGNGRDVYNNFVKPAAINKEQIANLWAISSLYKKHDDTINLYCYEITQQKYHKAVNAGTELVLGQLKIKSKVTTEESEISFALLQYAGNDFQCAISNSLINEEFENLAPELLDKFAYNPLIETIREIDKSFGSNYFTLQDIFMEERRVLLSTLLKDKLNKFSDNYRAVYSEGKDSILHLKKLGLNVPVEFKIAAQYTLSQDFNNQFLVEKNILDEDVVCCAANICDDAKLFDVEIDKLPTSRFFSKLVCQRIQAFAKTFESHRLESIMEVFEVMDKLKINVDISEAQNIYFTKVFKRFTNIIEDISQVNELIANRSFLLGILKLGDALNINTEFYKTAIIKITANDSTQITTNA